MMINNEDRQQQQPKSGNVQTKAKKEYKPLVSSKSFFFVCVLSTTYILLTELNYEK